MEATVTWNGCNQCNNSRGREYKIVETFLLGTYRYVTVNYDCSKCEGTSTAEKVANWCYGEVLAPGNPYADGELRPIGLYTKCQDWKIGERCATTDFVHLSKERLFKCCEVPPNLTGWYTFVASMMSQHTNPQWPSTIQPATWSYNIGSWSSQYNDNRANFYMQLLWDNNSISTITLATNRLPHIWVDGEPIFDPNGVSNETHGDYFSQPPRNYFEKCCNRYYYKFRSRSRLFCSGISSRCQDRVK